jgi:hypothetical protein
MDGNPLRALFFPADLSVAQTEGKPERLGSFIFWRMWQIARGLMISTFPQPLDKAIWRAQKAPLRGPGPAGAGRRG